MADRPIPFELPLFLAGITAPVEETLRQTGVPVARLPAETPGEIGGTNVAGRFVLFDSRVSAPPLNSQAAKICGLTTIDVSKLGSHAGGPFTGSGRTTRRVEPENGGAEELAFLVHLKREIESAGGVWLRVAEFPFPYQHVTCDPDAHEWGASELFWQTNRIELARWQQVRRNLAVRVQRQRTRYGIDYDGELDGFRPALELWRGSHVATLPLFPGGMSICESGLVFQRDGRRHPAGCWTKWVGDLMQGNSNKRARRRSA